MTAALKVISTLTVAGPMRELGAAFEAASGVKLDAEFGPTVLLTAKIKGGAAADLVMLTKEQLDV